LDRCGWRESANRRQFHLCGSYCDRRGYRVEPQRRDRAARIRANPGTRPSIPGIRKRCSSANGREKRKRGCTQMKSADLRPERCGQGRSKVARRDNRLGSEAEDYDLPLKRGSNSNVVGSPIFSFVKSRCVGFRRKLLSDGITTMGTCSATDVQCVTQSSIIALTARGGVYARQFFGNFESSILEIKPSSIVTAIAA